MPTREETKDSDLWIHSPMTRGRGNCDRFGLHDIGLSLEDMTNPVTVWRVCERYWKYPTGSLTSYMVEETARSVAEGYETKEFMVRPPTSRKADLEDTLQRRIDYRGRYPRITRRRHADP